MSLLQSANLGGGVKILEGVNTVYISEVSSPSRLWIQETDNNELDALSDAMGWVEHSSWSLQVLKFFWYFIESFTKEPASPWILIKSFPAWELQHLPVVGGIALKWSAFLAPLIMSSVSSSTSEQLALWSWISAECWLRTSGKSERKLSEQH